MDSGEDFDVSYELIRKDFPITKRMIYMNNGAVAPTPLSTIKATTNFMLKCAEEGPDFPPTADYISSVVNELRLRTSHLINCRPDEVVFVESTTQGLNYVANGIDWQSDDSIIVRGGTHEHYANYLPWLSLAHRRGIKLQELKMVDDSGNFDLHDLETLLTKEKRKTTKLVTMSHALYNTGAIMPLGEIGKIASQNDALFCVDAAQTVGSIEVDVQKIGCDFMAFPGFKWTCGPSGIGIFYCKKKSSNLLAPQSIGSESAILSKGVIELLEMPLKFLAGFRNYPGVAGLEASLRYILRLGINNIRKKNMKIANLLRSELGKIPNVTVYGPEDEKARTSIVTFSSSQDSRSIVKKLAQDNVVFAERDIGEERKAVRGSPHFFNSEEEVMLAANLIRKILR